MQTKLTQSHQSGKHANNLLIYIFILRTPILKYPLLKLSTFGGARPLNILLVTLKLTFLHFYSCTYSIICSLACLKAKTEEKLRNLKNTSCCLYNGQNQFCPLWERKKIKQTWIYKYNQKYLCNFVERAAKIADLLTRQWASKNISVPNFDNPKMCKITPP